MAEDEYQPDFTCDDVVQEMLHLDSLALCFDIDPTSVIRIIYKTLPELWRYFQNQIRWPNILEWGDPMGNRPEFPNVIGAI